jgi:hypothetical protein
MLRLIEFGGVGPERPNQTVDRRLTKGAATSRRRLALHYIQSIPRARRFSMTNPR